MSFFTTRVELHDEKDYTTLHAEMKKEGFWQTISLQGEDTVFHLPTAEYNYSSDTETPQQVLKRAKDAANRTGKKSSILVTKSDGRRYWDNLDIVKK